MTDEPEQLEVKFEHRDGWPQGAVSLPTGLRDKAEIADGTFTVGFSATESLVSSPTFVRLVEAGHTPVAGVPDDEQQAVQQRLGGTDATDDTSSDGDADSGEQGDETAPQEDADDELDELDRSELYEYAHNSEQVPEDEIPEWNETSEGGLRDLIREHEG